MLADTSSTVSYQRFIKGRLYITRIGFSPVLQIWMLIYSSTSWVQTVNQSINQMKKKPFLHFTDPLKRKERMKFVGCFLAFARPAHL